MAKYSKKEFATKCGMATNVLATYIRRKKVELTDEIIDTTIKINSDFLEKWQSKNGITTLVVVKKPNTPVAKNIPKDQKLVDEEGPLSEDSSDDRLSRAKKFQETELKSINVRLALLDEQKKKGELIPVSNVKTIVATHSRSITSAFRYAAEQLIIRFSLKKKLTLDETAQLKAELIKIINAGVDTAVTKSKIDIRNLIKEFSETREVGEHD